MVPNLIQIVAGLGGPDGKPIKFFQNCSLFFFRVCWLKKVYPNRYLQISSVSLRGNIGPRMLGQGDGEVGGPKSEEYGVKLRSRYY